MIPVDIEQKNTNWCYKMLKESLFSLSYLMYCSTKYQFDWGNVKKKSAIRYHSFV